MPFFRSRPWSFTTSTIIVTREGKASRAILARIGASAGADPEVNVRTSMRPLSAIRTATRWVMGRLLASWSLPRLVDQSVEAVGRERQHVHLHARGGERHGGGGGPRRGGAQPPPPAQPLEPTPPAPGP